MKRLSGKASTGADTFVDCGGAAVVGAGAASPPVSFGRGSVAAPTILRGCGNVNPFFVFGTCADDGTVVAVSFASLDGPPNTPRVAFASWPQPPFGRTGQTPVLRGAGTLGAGIDDFVGVAATTGVVTTGAGFGVGARGVAALLLLLPRLGHALATGTPTPTAFGGGGPAGGGGGILFLGAGTRTPAVNGAGIAVRLDVRGRAAPMLSLALELETTRVAS